MKNIYIFLILLALSIQLMSNNMFIDESDTELELRVEERVITRKDVDPFFPFNLGPEDIAWVENTLKTLTLEEKAAQMIMPWVNAEAMKENSTEYKRLVRLVSELKVGGFIFFEGNILNQVHLTNKMQELSDIPLLIASDFERGLGMRLKDATEFPYNMAIAAANDVNLTYEMGRVVAAEAIALGVHQNYAPTADINENSRNPIINIRAYSEDRDITVKHTLAFIAGSSVEGAITTVKHFPGHGATDVDSHTELPLLTHSKETFESIDLVPFREAINAGVKSVMVGHLDVPAFEENRGLPASLSEPIISGLLKKEMGFTGLVVTDAMNMSGVTKYYKPDLAAVLAVKAGNDILLFPPDENISLKGLVRAVENGEMSEERIDYSVRKILAAKRSMNLHNKRFVNIQSLDSVLNKKSHKRLAQQIADKSITLVKDENNIIPVDPQRYYNPSVIFLSDSKSPSRYPMKDLLKERFRNLKTTTLHRKSKPADYQNALTIAGNSDLVLVPIFARVRASGTIQLPERHTELVRDLSSKNIPVVFMSMGNPYMMSEFPEVPVYLCSYGDPMVSQNAMVKAISGESDITGKLPINIPGTEYMIGDGIEKKKNVLRVNKNNENTEYNFSTVDSIMAEGIRDSVFPGAVLYFGHESNLIYKKAFGKYSYEPGAQDMTTEAIFDLASVSKVIGTTTAAMLLYDDGKLDLDERVTSYLPEFGNNGKEFITVRNLLLHNAGLPAWVPFYKQYSTADEVINAIMNIKPEYSVGSKFLYSDLSMITLQKIIEKISGLRLDNFLKVRVFDKLGMTKTMYNPPPELWYFCAPTEKDTYWRMNTMKGKVHDETAYMLNGIAGHAGLFSTAEDLSVFLQMMLQKGKYKDMQIIKESTVDSWTTIQGEQSTRGLGWDTKSETGSSAGKLFSSNSFGHTGFTGTSVWVDKDKKLFAVLLTNRVNPTRANTKIIQFRPKVHDEIVKSIMYQ